MKINKTNLSHLSKKEIIDIALLRNNDANDYSEYISELELKIGELEYKLKKLETK